jgi:hypothetical protein
VGVVGGLGLSRASYDETRGNEARQCLPVLLTKQKGRKGIESPVMSTVDGHLPGEV